VNLLIIVIIVGLTVMVTTAVVVGIMDARQRSLWREIARQRRMAREREQAWRDHNG
jgi:hypothetical protein